MPGVTAVFAAKLRCGRVEGLPVFKEDPRQVKKDRAGNRSYQYCEDFEAGGVMWVGLVDSEP